MEHILDVHTVKLQISYRLLPHTKKKQYTNRRSNTKPPSITGFHIDANHHNDVNPAPKVNPKHRYEHST
jgi:hypothetical protein